MKTLLVTPFITFRLFWYCLALLGLLTQSSGWAQPVFRRLSTAQGLSQSSVMSIHQDRMGFMWVATSDGLNRYDGYGFQVFRHQPQDSTSLTSSDIVVVDEDGSGRIWVGLVAGGVNYLDPQTGRFRSVPLPTSTGRAVSVSALKARGHDVWVSTYDKGLFHINTRTMTVQWLSQLGSLVDASTTALTFGADGTCWVASAGGRLCQVSATSLRVLRQFMLPAAESNHRISALYEDSHHRLWIGSNRHGIYQLKPGQPSLQRVLHTPGQVGGINFVTAFVEDQRQAVWIGTDNGVLVAPKGDLSAVTHYRSNANSDQGLSSHAVKSLYTDRDGTVWVGTWEAGLNAWVQQPERFRSLTFKANAASVLPSHKVTAIGGDKQGNVWIGTNAGLTFWQPAQNRFERWVPSRIPDREVNAIYNQPTDHPVIGIWNQAFCVWDARSRTFRSRLKENGFGHAVSNNSVRAFAPARSGGIWVSTEQDGLLWYHPETDKIRVYKTAADGNEFTGISPTTLHETADSTLWFGTFNNGLWAYDLRTGLTRRFEQSARPGSLSDNHILSLLEDSHKKLWIGTNSGGLNRFDPQTGCFDVYTTADGLANNTVKAIVEDSQGRLWISTNDGLSCLDAARKTFTNYSVSDGLPGREFMMQAAYRSPSGHLYFGGMDGLTYFHPDSIKPNATKSPVYLTGLRLFNHPVVVGAPSSPLDQPLSQTRQVILQPNQSMFTIDFIALNLQQAPTLQYAYRLDGFDTDWNYVGQQRSATFTNLDPGDYVFRVKAASGNGPWNEAQVLSIRVLSPWYRTGWAFLAYALLIVATVGTLRRIIKIRERFRSDLRIQRIEADKVRELDRLKTNFFTSISHEFRTPLTLIISPLEQLLKADTSPEDNPVRWQHRLMYQNANRLLRLINQLLDLSKLEAGHLQPVVYQNTLPDFVERLAKSFEPAAEQQGLTLSLDLSFPDDPVWYDPDVLEKVVTNLLANAIKHTPKGGTVRVGLQAVSDGFAELIVSDTGIGIPARELVYIFDRFFQVKDQRHQKAGGSGVGLALTKELIELVGGSISVQSKVDSGTTFTVRFPVEEHYFAPHLLQQTEMPATSSQQVIELNYKPVVDVPVQASRQTLLVVEDNDELRAYIRSLFTQQFTVIEAVDGQDGWQKTLQLAPDFIISDLVMPNMNGVELCQSVKATAQTSHIPLILLTSRQSADSQLEGLAAGADDYVTKPFNAQVLESRITNILRSREQLRARFSRVISVQPSEITTTSADEVFLTRALQFVEARIDDPGLSLDELSDALNLSEKSLYRKLKSLTGLSGLEFIRSVRLKRAAQWLQSEEGLTISEIGYRVGFRDPAYFTRCFTKEFGQSPKHYAQGKPDGSVV